jgi:hypothetical protein
MGALLVLVVLGALAAASVACALVALALSRAAPPIRPAARPPAAGAVAQSRLPAPARNDAQCVTYMGNDKDTGDCHALVYNHCTAGYKDQGAIPAAVAALKGTALAQLYDAEKAHFASKPSDWTTVCVARPDKAGTGACAGIKPGEFRVWAAGKQSGGDPAPCVSGGALYLKSHFSADGKLLVSGTVGHG